MSLFKNPGPLLISEGVGELELIPKEYRAKIGTKKLVQQVPVDVPPDPLAGDLVQSWCNQERTDERTKVNIELLGDINTPLGDSIFIRETCQVGHRERKLVPEGTPLPAPNCLLWDAEQHNLGNGLLDQIITTVDHVYPDKASKVTKKDVTPQEFDALVPLQYFEETNCDIFTEVDPDELTDGELEKGRQMVSECKTKHTHTFRDLLGLPKQIIDSKTNQFKQIEYDTKILDLETTLPPNPTSTTDVNWIHLGDGTAVTGIQGTATLFPQKVFQREKPDVTPEVFRALLQTKTESIFEEGIAADPYPLPTGRLKETQKQEDVFNRRVDKVSRDILGLPKTVTDAKTNKFKQVLYDVKTLDLDTVFPPTPTSTSDVEWTHLGDGTAVTDVQATEDLFPAPVYSNSIENLIPPKFRAFIPTKTIEFTSDDPIDIDPDLTGGKLLHEQQQIDVYNKRVKITFINVTIPPNVVSTDEETTEQFGGGVLDAIYTLAVAGSLTIDTGKRVVESQITDLGNGYEIKTTKRLQDTNWPALDGQDYDDHFDVVLPFTQQVVDANTGIGTPRTEIKPIDKWREQTRTVDVSAIQDVLDVYVLSYPSRINVDLPDKLVACEGVEDSTFGEGVNEETGDFDPGTGSYSVALSLKASAQSSAAVLFDVKTFIKQFWGSNIPCIEYHFFLPSPVEPADILTKLATLVGSISSWPKYSPEMVVFSISGQRVSLQVTASSQGSASASTSGAYSTTGGGTGYSREVGLNLKVVRISPTIHGAISLTGDTTDTINISADAHAVATGLGPDESESQSAVVTGGITPTSISATSGDTDWPSSGKYLYKVDAQPYRFGYVQIHCVVVDAADFPS